MILTNTPTLAKQDELPTQPLLAQTQGPLILQSPPLQQGFTEIHGAQLELPSFVPVPDKMPTDSPPWSARTFANSSPVLNQNSLEHGLSYQSPSIPGIHHQPQLVQGDHHQPQPVHEAHYQPQAAHGNHHQPQLVQGDHHQSQAVHAAHHQPQVAHGAHHQPQAVHAAHYQPRSIHAAHHQSQATQGCRPSCLTIIVSTAVVATIVTVSALVLFFYILPGKTQPTLNMPTNVSPGEIITVQGSNFSPGLHILMTLDTPQKTLLDKPASLAQADLLGSLQTRTRQFSQQGMPLVIKADGTFTTTIQADPSWPTGSQHTIYISQQNGSLIVRKQFTIKAGNPALALCSVSATKATITLGPVAAGQSATISTPFKLCTQGSGQVNWSSSWNTQQAPWLQLVQSGQVQAPQTLPLQLSASAASLTPGNYTTTVTFTSKQSTTKITVDVTLIVQDPNAQTCIQPGSTSLTLTSTSDQSNPVQQPVTITNCGENGNWSAVTATDDGANWLSINPSNGTLQKGASQDLVVTATTTNLVAGTYTGHITFGSGSNAAQIGVTLVITNTPQSIPCLAVNTGQLNFIAIAQENNPDTQTVTITNNCGSGSWSATSDQSWLSLSATNGTINANDNTNTNVQASIANLAAGTYTGHITFSPGTAQVTVTLNVQQGPCISVLNSPQNIAVMEGQTANVSATVYISNDTNCAPGAWTAQSDVPWITPTTLNGSLNAGATTEVSLTVDETAAGTGTFSGHITFSPGSSSSVMTINLTVYRRLCISANPTSVSISNITPSSTFTVSNNCPNAGTLSISSITTDNNAPWLQATGGGQLDVGGSQTFTVKVNFSALNDYNSHTGQISITITGSDGGTATIYVNVQYDYLIP